jgi:hypothetical protein
MVYFWLLMAVLAIRVEHVMALSSSIINVGLVSLSLVILTGAAVSCIIMYYFRGNKQPPLSSLENRTSHDLLVEDNINIDGKKKRAKKKDKEKEKEREKEKKSKEKEKEKKSKTQKNKTEQEVDSDIERGRETETAPLINPTAVPTVSEKASPTEHTTHQKRMSTFGFFGRRNEKPTEKPIDAQQVKPPTPPAARPETPLTIVAGSSNEVVENPLITSTSRPPLGKDKDKEIPVVRTKEEISVKEDNKKKVPALNLTVDAGNRDGGNSSDNSPRDETSSVTSKRSANSNSTNRISLTRHLGSKASSGSEAGSVPQPLPSPPTKGNSVLQQKLEKLKQNKQAAATASSASDTSDGEGVVKAPLNPSSPTLMAPNTTVPEVPNSKSSVARDSVSGISLNGAGNGSKVDYRSNSPLMNSALRNTFIATLSEGLQIVHHTEKGGQPSKLYFADNFIIIEKKAIFQRKPIKFDLKSITRIEIGRKTAVLLAAGKSVQDSCCFSLITSEGDIDIEMPSKAERDAVVRGFHILLQI